MFYSILASRTRAWIRNGYIVGKTNAPFFAITYLDSLGVTSEVQNGGLPVATRIISVTPDHAHSWSYYIIEF